MKVASFLGINNVADPTQLKAGELTAAANVDIGLRGKLLSRRGRVLLRTGGVQSLFETPFGTFGLAGNDLLLFDTAGAPIRTVYETLGYERVWYTLLPDGRVAFSNGLIHGLASATETLRWGIPRPDDTGTGLPGNTGYAIAYVRISDGLEGPSAYGTMSIDPAEQIIGLPMLAGHTINVYFAPHGGAMYYAGNTATDSFHWAGGHLGALRHFAPLDAPPVGTLLHVWNSRVLIAQGDVLWATRPFQPELCDLARDFIQLPAAITALFSTATGVFVGTEETLYFLEGRSFEELRMTQAVPGRVTLGSCVEFNLEHLNEKARPAGVQRGALLLLDGVVTLVYGTGEVLPLTASTYRRPLAEVHAVIRLRDGVAHYLAAPV